MYQDSSDSSVTSEVSGGDDVDGSGTPIIVGLFYASFACILGLFCLYIGSLLTLAMPWTALV
jgi:hypothetical protein